MRLVTSAAFALSPLLLCGCMAKRDEAAGRPKAAIESIQTGLGPGSCKQVIDKNDPNGTSYLLCPGVAGYSLIVRRVDSGRQSIDVVDAAQRVHPLDYQEFVTRHMSNLDGNAEWRVAARDGKQVPIALIVRVQAREDNDNPEKVTRSYLAVAKLAPETACVTGTMPEGTPEAEVRRTADSALERPCAQPLPPMTSGEVVIR